MALNIFEIMGSNHSRAYAEICNLIALTEHHRIVCQGDCGASTYLIKKTVDRLVHHCFENEKGDIMLKVAETNWL